MSVEGTNNFRDEYSPAFGAVFSTRLGDRGSVYVEPMWVGNTNRPLFHPEPGFSSEGDGSLLVGLGTRVRVLETVYVAAEYVPRLGGFDNGNDHLSFGLKKRVGGHLFQVNFSNGLGVSPAQVAQGGNNADWYIGFNITRKFY